MTMIETPDVLIQTPSFVPGIDTRRELLADVLSHVRLSGALFLRGQMTAPWAVDSPGNCDLVDLLAPGAERLLVFHAVRRGHMAVTALGQRIELSAGEIGVLPNADRHTLASLLAPQPVPIADLLPPVPWIDIPVVRTGGGGEPTELVCGYFRCDELLFNSLLRRLPPVFSIRPEGAVAALLEAAINYALEDGSRSGGQTAMARLTELLLSEALRLYADSDPGVGGWLAAANDPVVGRALKALHDDPVRDWGADELARAAHTSRSVLGQRFRDLLGQSPIRYLVEWRMQLAADLLRSSELKLAAIAERAGYGSEAAFSRAFHRHLGQSPAQWRESVSRRRD